MSGSNGHAHVSEEMREPLRPLAAADMSSQQRNALLDEMVRVVNGNARALAELRRTMTIEHLRFQQDLAFNQFHAKPLWLRLRWIVTGR